MFVKIFAKCFFLIYSLNVFRYMWIWIFAKKYTWTCNIDPDWKGILWRLIHNQYISHAFHKSENDELMLLFTAFGKIENNL